MLWSRNMFCVFCRDLGERPQEVRSLNWTGRTTIRDFSLVQICPCRGGIAGLTRYSLCTTLEKTSPFRWKFTFIYRLMKIKRVVYNYNEVTNVETSPSPLHSSCWRTKNKEQKHIVSSREFVQLGWKSDNFHSKKINLSEVRLSPKGKHRHPFIQLS